MNADIWGFYFGKVEILCFCIGFCDENNLDFIIVLFKLLGFYMLDVLDVLLLF